MTSTIWRLEKHLVHSGLVTHRRVSAEKGISNTRFIGTPHNERLQQKEPEENAAPYVCTEKQYSVMMIKSHQAISESIPLVSFIPPGVHP